MARKRMIDPSIWINEGFGTLTNLAELVYIGLVSIADDEGRGKASPAYIKAVLFPYKDDLRIADIEKTLFEISSKMSVIFYSCDGNKYYTLTSWEVWQKIDKPSQSKIPEYDEKTMSLLFDEHSTNNSRIFSPNKNRIEKNIKRKEEEEKEIKRKKIVELYNSNCSSLPKIQKVTDKREKSIDNFLKEFSINQFKDICIKANSSDFLTGINERGWKADFDFIMRIDKATAILEGKYDNKESIKHDEKKETEEEKNKRRAKELEETIKNASK